MTRFVGLDWAGTGWIAIESPDGATVEGAYYPSALAAVRANSDAESILVDVPIGLPEAGRRDCDRLARQELGGRASTVFDVPVREAVYADSYDRACDLNEAATGRRISTQSYHLCPRIREVDALVRTLPAARGRLREAHPEACFARLAGEPMAAAKTTEKGLERRRELLGAHTAADAPGAIERAFLDDQPIHARRLRADCRDDILDAFVLCVTAAGPVESLPGTPPRDRHGLPMEIVVPATDGRGSGGGPP